MVTISTDGGAAMPEPGDSTVDVEAAEQGEQRLKHKKAAAKMATVRSGHFIIGYLLRNLRTLRLFIKTADNRSRRGMLARAESGTANPAQL
jgi:hypothetical protein